MTMKVQAEVIYRRSIINQIVPVFALHMVVKKSVQGKLSSHRSDILKNSCSSDSRIAMRYTSKIRYGSQPGHS